MKKPYHGRKIVHYNITRNPNIRFLKSQFSSFEESYPGSYLIHDNSGEMKHFPYEEYEINGVATTPYFPNMKTEENESSDQACLGIAELTKGAAPAHAYAERFIRSVRQECLDWFVIFSEKQLRNILRSYMEYYNRYKPHQGINAIPDGRPPDISGKIKMMPNLFELHNHYYRAS